jgi:hypothetical protein
MNSKTHDANLSSTFSIGDITPTLSLDGTVQVSTTFTSAVDMASIQGPAANGVFPGVDIDLDWIPDTLDFGANGGGGHYVDVASLNYSSSGSNAALEYLENGALQQAFVAIS